MKPPLMMATTEYEVILRLDRESEEKKEAFE